MKQNRKFKTTEERKRYLKGLKKLPSLPTTYEDTLLKESSLEGSDVSSHSNGQQFSDNVRKKSLKLVLKDFLKERYIEIIVSIVGIIMLSFLIPTVIKTSINHVKIINIKEDVKALNNNSHSLEKKLQSLYEEMDRIEDDGSFKLQEIKSEIKMIKYKLDVEIGKIENEVDLINQEIN